MNPNFLQFTNVKIVTGMAWETVPTDQLFAEKGKSIIPGNGPWDLKDFTGEKVDLSKCVIIRTEVTAPREGEYILGAGGDWLFRIRMDGQVVMDTHGDCPPSSTDHEVTLKLKAGKHVLDVNFSRGANCAVLDLSLLCCCNLPDADKLSPLEKILRCRGEAMPAVDLNTKTGRLRKELHGSNTTLVLSSRKLNKYDNDLKKLNFTLARTHDWALWNAGQRIIDTHFVFPLMKADPGDPSNYYFDATDEIIRLTQEVAGLEVFYRLGSSIEHSGDIHFNVVPPKDYDKYAEVLAGIVRHYTRGWANGFHYKIRYWEIWNEPEGYINMWFAPYETFIPFFVTVLKRLKSEFPELQFGGPAMCSLNFQNFEPLLKACKEAGVAPDFISWHSYSANAKGLIRQPAAARKMLDDMGFTKTKLCINEWHYLEDWKGVQSSASPEEYQNALLKGPSCLTGINSGVYNLTVLSGWQETPLDLAMWYGASWDSPAWGYRNVFREFTKNYYSMELFGRFLKEYPVKCKSVFSEYAGPRLLVGCSEDGRKAGILVTDYKGRFEEFPIEVNGLSSYSKVSAIALDETRNNEPFPVIVKDGRIILKKEKPGSAAFLIQLEK